MVQMEDMPEAQASSSGQAAQSSNPIDDMRQEETEDAAATLNSIKRHAQSETGQSRGCEGDKSQDANSSGKADILTGSEADEKGHSQAWIPPIESVGRFRDRSVGSALSDLSRRVVELERLVKRSTAPIRFDTEDRPGPSNPFTDGYFGTSRKLEAASTSELAPMFDDPEDGFRPYSQYQRGHSDQGQRRTTVYGSITAEGQEQLLQQQTFGENYSRQVNTHAKAQLELGDQVRRAREAVPPRFLPDDAMIPQLSRREWSDFKLAEVNDRYYGKPYAVDVLIGEPIIRPGQAVLPSSSRILEREQAAGSQELEHQQDISQKERVGQNPLPERIRINSRHLTRLLENIHGRSFTNGPFVMTRPFRMLIHYELRLREWYNQLETSFPEPQPRDEPTSADTSRAPTSDPRKAASQTPPAQDEPTTEARKSELRDRIGGEHSLIHSRTTLKHLRCLLEFMDIDLLPRVDLVRDVRCEKVTFDDIWHMFKPGDEIVSNGGQQVYRVISTFSDGHDAGFNPFARSKPKKLGFQICCVYIDFDGQQLGPVRRNFIIGRFDGEKSVRSLPISPFHGDSGLRQRLIERGKKFLHMTEVRHMHYNGLTLESREEVDSQVVVDFEEAFTTGEAADRYSELRPSVENLVGEVLESPRPLQVCDFDCCIGERVHDDSYAENARNAEFMDRQVPQNRAAMPSLVVYPRSRHDAGNTEYPINDDEYLIMSHRVFGFILRTRRWSRFLRLCVLIVDHRETLTERLFRTIGYRRSRRSS